MNHLSAWITKQEDIERDCEALGGPIVVDAMIRMIGTQDTYLPWKNLQRDETRQKIPGTLVIHQVLVTALGSLLGVMRPPTKATTGVGLSVVRNCQRSRSQITLGAGATYPSGGRKKSKRRP